VTGQRAPSPRFSFFGLFFSLSTLPSKRGSPFHQITATLNEDPFPVPFSKNSLLPLGDGGVFLELDTPSTVFRSTLSETPLCPGFVFSRG